MRAFWALLFLTLFSAGWAWGDGYYMKLRKSSPWYLRGEGTLWDSAWMLRHIRAVETDSPSEWLWEIAQTLRAERAFEELRFSYTGKGNGQIYARTREPVARIVLPLRQYYLDGEGERLPFVKPLDLPVIEVQRWDSTALSEILRFWQKQPLYRQLTSHLYQDQAGVWYLHTEISSETFVLGRTPHLRTGLEQFDVYLRSLQPHIGGHTCKVVLLYIPDQIICQ